MEDQKIKELKLEIKRLKKELKEANEESKSHWKALLAYEKILRKHGYFTRKWQ